MIGIILTIIILAIIAGLGLYLKELKSESKNLPYKPNPNHCFFNPAEKSFYHVLESTIENKFKIFSKVRLIDLVKITATGKNYWRYRGKISQKHIDFILCDPKELKIKLAIELDGSQHNNPEEEKRDEFKNRVLNTIGIPIIRIKAQRTYNPQELKKKIKNILGPTSTDNIFTKS